MHLSLDTRWLMTSCFSLLLLAFFFWIFCMSNLIRTYTTEDIFQTNWRPILFPFDTMNMTHTHSNSLIGQLEHMFLVFLRLRSPKSPDPTADMGEHEFTYAIMPHGGKLCKYTHNSYTNYTDLSKVAKLLFCGLFGNFLFSLFLFNYSEIYKFYLLQVLSRTVMWFSMPTISTTPCLYSPVPWRRRQSLISA